MVCQPTLYVPNIFDYIIAIKITFFTIDIPK